MMMMLFFSYLQDGYLYDEMNNRTILSNDANYLEQTFIMNAVFLEWQECCQNALDCCLNYIKVKSKPKNNQNLHCPRTWDGWSCWSQSVPPNTTALMDCPKHAAMNWGLDINPPPCRGKNKL